MLRMVLVMENTIPDPASCTHEEWDAYVASVDVFSMTSVQAQQHRAALEAYSRRLRHESTRMHDDTVRVLDQRDRAYANAEDLSQQCRNLQDEVLRLGGLMLELHRQYGARDDRVVDARRARDAAAERLNATRQKALAANHRAAVAFKQAR